MNNEFRGRTIEEVVRKAVHRGYICKSNDEECRQLQSILADLRSDWDQSLLDILDLERALANVEAELEAEKLRKRFETEAENIRYRQEVVEVLALIAGVAIPAFRVAKAGLKAYRVGSSISAAIREGASFGDALLGGISLLGLGLRIVEPSTARRVDHLARELELRKNKSARMASTISRHLDRMKRAGCEVIEA